MERIGTEVIIYGEIISCKVSLYMQVPFSFWFTLIDYFNYEKYFTLFSFSFFGEVNGRR